MSYPQHSHRTVRTASVAGRFYPASDAVLTRQVRDCLADSKAVETGRPLALITPHAGYVCSAIVAASAYRTLSTLPPALYTVYLMGPAHRKAVHGVGLSGASSFETPLGAVPVATDIVRQLVDSDPLYKVADDAHAPEHCLEVQLPFLQTLMSEFCIVPMLLDDEADASHIAGDIIPRLESDPYSLVIVSSDLSHYLSYKEASTIDRQLLDAIASGDVSSVEHGVACGLPAILALMAIAASLGWTPHVADYRNSGDTCGPRDEVVGYGAVVYD